MNPTLAKSLLTLAISTIAALGFSSMALAQNAAVVNGRPIPKIRVDALVTQIKEDAARNRQPLPPNLEARIREHLIKESVAVQQAERLKLNLTPEYAEKIARARGAILTSMLFEQYKKDHPISDAAIKAEYDQAIAHIPLPAAGTVEYRAHHILVKTAAQARALQAELATGKSFEALAAKYSIDPGSAKNGGDLGWAPAQAYVPGFSSALQKLKKGQVTLTPIQTQFGYHIIRLDDTRSPQPPAFEAVKEQIRQQMQTAQATDFERYLENLESSARIE